MSKLAHSNQKTMDEIEARARDADDDFIDDEATEFAAYLLVPERFLEADLAKAAHVDIDDEKWLEKLCRRYRVSKGLMQYRLRLRARDTAR